MDKDRTLEGYLNILLLHAEVCSCRHSKTENLQTLQKRIPVLKWRTNLKSVFSNAWLGTSYSLLSVSSTHSTSNTTLPLNSCLCIFENISISSISLLLPSLHSLVYSVFSYKLVWIFQISDQFNFLFWPFYTWSKGGNSASRLNWGCANFNCLPLQP